MPLRPLLAVVGPQRLPLSMGMGCLSFNSELGSFSVGMGRGDGKRERGRWEDCSGSLRGMVSFFLFPFLSPFSKY